MKTLFTLSIIFSISINIIAQTEVSGNQLGTWTSSNSPYLVVGEIIVPAGETLNIEAGVEVNFQNYYKFIVNGNLQALGTESDSIFFTTDNQVTAWGGIRFDDSQGISNLSYCRIEYGKTGGEYPDIHGGGVALLGSDAVFSNCIFADNDATGEENGMGGAVYAIGTGSDSGPLTKFIDCKFIRNHAFGEGGAIKFTGDMNTEIISCEFIENDCNYGGGAISFYSVMDTKVIYCLFVNNYTMYSDGGAIHSLGFANSMFFENCTITENSAVTGDGGGVYLAYAEADFVNTIIYDNPGAYSDDFYLGIGAHAEVNYSNLSMPDGASGNNNINENPEFVNPEELDFHLLESSPCIDAGIDIGYEFYGEAPDMGCFEYGLPTNILDLPTSDILIYPNPAKHIVNIENTDNVEELYLTDISGKKVLNVKNFDNVQMSIDVSDFNNGIYFVNLLYKTEDIKTYKLLIQN